MSTTEEEKVDQDSKTDEVEEGDEGGAMVEQKK